MKHLLTLEDWSPKDISVVIAASREVKTHPEKYQDALKGKTLCMFFEKPSLRTRLSFEAGMNQLGGHAIYYDTSTSPLGAGKESIGDTIQTTCRYVDIIMARLFKHSHMEEMAQYTTVPLINALTDYEHPGQILADLQTIVERKGGLAGLKIAYFGDAFNNVTHSLMFACPKMGMHLFVACPEGKAFEPSAAVLRKAKKDGEVNGGSLTITHSAPEAAKDADVIYTDSWMSYHIPKEQAVERVKIFEPYRVNSRLMKLANPQAVFMNCLPAARGMEQTADVIDGPQSIVFDQAENRMHTHKGLMLLMLKKMKGWKL